MATSSEPAAPRRPKVPLDQYEKLLAGGGAGALAKTVTAPLDRIKLLYQVDPRRVFTFGDAARRVSRIASETGFLSLWRGNGLAMIHVIPYGALVYMTFDNYHELLVDNAGVSALPARFIAGAGAGASATVVAYPLDLLRARVMAHSGPTDKYPLGMLSALLDISRREGIHTLWRGLSPTMIGIVPYAGAARRAAPGRPRVPAARAAGSVGCRLGRTVVLPGGPRRECRAACGPSHRAGGDLRGARAQPRARGRLRCGGLPATAPPARMRRRPLRARAARACPPNRPAGAPPRPRPAGISFSIFETSKVALKDLLGLTSDSELPTVLRLSSGAVAGVVAQSVTYPLHVVRRRMQVRAERARARARALGRARGTLHVLARARARTLARIRPV